MGDSKESKILWIELLILLKNDLKAEGGVIIDSNFISEENEDSLWTT